jgi:hypothetical protein
MFDKIFKQDAAPAAAAGAQRGAESPAGGIPEGELQAWHEKILAAKGDDSALLQLAHQAPGADLKLAALAALTQEDALKQAMREFREQDKRLYRAAKARWETAVARREAFEQAPLLIATARSLLEQEGIPANRLVELDRAWSALKTGFLDEALVSEFAAVRAQLGSRVRSHGEAEQAVARWLTAVDPAVSAVTAGLAELARGAAPARSDATRKLAAALLQLVNEAPPATDPASEARVAEKLDAANRALALASSVVQRAEFLRSLPVAGAAEEAEEKAKIEQWRSIPEVSDDVLQSVLAHRFSDWRNAGEQERQRDREARRRHEGELNAQERKRRITEMQHHVELAEAAHAGGQVAELTRLMNVIDAALKPGPVNAELARRIESLRQEQQRLRDWQRWSGGQRREELVAEAQALAKQAGEKVALKAHGEAIDKLRERWKELDKLSAATTKTLWLAFDGALKAAYVPVAAHLEKLKVARTENLAARNRIIEAVLKTAGDQQDLRAIARALEEAKIAWRRLGPVEHTVPREAQKGEQSVAARFASALQALEAPLTKAYEDAGRQREAFIAAAKSLAEATPLARDSIDRVRALQAQWQAHAKALPLPRRDENAFWTAFKAATDAVFTARDAARAAREAEANAPIKAREAVIDGLLALPAEITGAQIKRALADADTAWRASPRIHGPQAARIESRYREARDTASRRLRAIADRAALARYDALLAAMRLCAEREAGSEPSPDLESRYSALTDLPPAWKTAMDARFNGTTPAKRPPLADTLLNLEAALSIDSPPDFTAARRALKMLALKNAMENRRPDAGASPADIERWLLDASSTPRPDDTSRARLEKIIAAVQSRPSRSS